ncbi:DUF4314 domain-containing protein [Actinomadura sp. 7K507]|nr:DUF4314 domain-containing protein [Actinomadura sp. 7K507]
MHLGDDRTRQVIDDNLRAGALLTCHATLPYGDHPHFGPAVCAGFWTRHRNQVPAGRLAQLFLGITRVQPQEGDDPGQPAAPADQSEEQPRTQVAGCSARRGSRIRLVATSDPYTDLEPGALGTVTRIDDLGTLTVRWDDGHTLGLIPGLDQFDLL